MTTSGPLLVTRAITIGLPKVPQRKILRPIQGITNLKAILDDSECRNKPFNTATVSGQEQEKLD
ncbi:uncharacterized protein N7518_004421 [Penicillium psychrosexuale]|uniref:uncharacterized protein n=1 Tax=Penicillium psychrosexuale TaxID=1002107 RepID=UPI002544D589|nr:uncharacterized protein N7518_004421 [Penicillium psychrosexuale]KAJ5795881.1 hypothetical protein N7518_004421 [Penicillium psychrosexuale]